MKCFQHLRSASKCTLITEKLCNRSCVRYFTDSDILQLQIHAAFPLLHSDNGPILDLYWANNVDTDHGLPFWLNTDLLRCGTIFWYSKLLLKHKQCVVFYPEAYSYVMEKWHVIKHNTYNNVKYMFPAWSHSVMERLPISPHSLLGLMKCIVDVLLFKDIYVVKWWFVRIQFLFQKKTNAIYWITGHIKLKTRSTVYWLGVS